MQTIMTCPKTSATVVFDVPGDETTLAQFWSHAVHVNCPMCEGLHVLRYGDLYKRSVMAEFSCMPADLKREDRLH
jgi:hypothetical protein